MSPQLTAAVQAMLKRDGLYALKCDNIQLGAIAPLWVMEGKIWAVKKAQQIAADGFLEGAEIIGPLYLYPESKK